MQAASQTSRLRAPRPAPTPRNLSVLCTSIDTRAANRSQDSHTNLNHPVRVPDNRANTHDQIRASPTPKPSVAHPHRVRKSKSPVEPASTSHHARVDRPKSGSRSIVRPISATSSSHLAASPTQAQTRLLNPAAVPRHSPWPSHTRHLSKHNPLHNTQPSVQAQTRAPVPIALPRRPQFQPTALGRAIQPPPQFRLHVPARTSHIRAHADFPDKARSASASPVTPHQAPNTSESHAVASLPASAPVPAP